MRSFSKVVRRNVPVALLAPLVVSALALSGCVSSPTYGTDKTSAEQLVGDLSNAFSLKPKDAPNIDYKPRPTLVAPGPGTREVLPPPQEKITQTAANEWPETPEQRRQRLRDYATEHRDDPNYEPQVINDVSVASQQTRRRPKSFREHGDENLSTANKAGNAARRAEINRRLRERGQGDPNSRKYLSEPPTEYRVPAATAPQNDIGEDEFKKARRLKKEAAAKSGKKNGWFDWW